MIDLRPQGSVEFPRKHLAEGRRPGNAPLEIQTQRSSCIGHVNKTSANFTNISATIVCRITKYILREWTDVKTMKRLHAGEGEGGGESIRYIYGYLITTTHTIEQFIA